MLQIFSNRTISKQERIRIPCRPMECTSDTRSSLIPPKWNTFCTLYSFNNLQLITNQLWIAHFLQNLIWKVWKNKLIWAQICLLHTDLFFKPSLGVRSPCCKSFKCKFLKIKHRMDFQKKGKYSKLSIIRPGRYRLLELKKKK